MARWGECMNAKPVSKISIKLNEKYKSFEKGFERELEGDLIVLTGVNGSGKSQLLDIIRTLQVDNRSINSIIIAVELFSARQNRENSGVTKLTTRFESISGKKLYEFSSQLEVEEFLNSNKFADYIFEYDNIFTYGNLSDLFLSYLQKRRDYRDLDKENYTNREKDFEKNNRKPWVLLNDIFDQFNFDYKFADNYEPINNTIKGGVKLLNKNEEALPFGVENLSDGEKAIFSLAVASMKAGLSGVLPKILLLDEYDATFNPSLTEAFYYILEEFFVKKGVTVILTTHNPTTVAFAPKSDDYKTTFYEINKPNSGKERVEPKKWEEVEEAKMVLRKFYPQVGEYEKEIEGLRKQLSEVKNECIVFCEGETDPEYLNKASEVLNIPLDVKFLWIGRKSDSKNNKSGVFTGHTALSQTRDFCLANPQLVPQKLVLLYDCDVEKISNEDLSDKLYVRKIGNLENNPIKSGIENLFEQSTIDKTREQNKDWIIKNITERSSGDVVTYTVKSKVEVQKWLCENGTEQDFKNFKPIFDTIREILKVN